jgi:glycosyltransferase involved in cell wall biosynthesis
LQIAEGWIVTTKLKKIVWLVPESKGGIRDYADFLWPSIFAAAGNFSYEVVRVDCAPICSNRDLVSVVQQIKALKPDLIHVQHEFGLFGSKIFPFYKFPRLAKALRRIAPTVATGHNVLASDYALSWRGRGIQGYLRLLFNLTILPFARNAWLKGTWGKLSGVIVHSNLQHQAILDSGCTVVQTIPHFVPDATNSVVQHGESVVVFGFFSRDKAQDIVIRAWPSLGDLAPNLILAGGVRRQEDREYFESCEKLIDDLRLQDKIKITGYVPADSLNKVYKNAALVIAPFRETSGSGSIVQAFARGKPVLASNLSLNLELNERVPGCLSFFKSEDEVDCAAQISRLFNDLTSLSQLSSKGSEYAATFNLSATAESHLRFYSRFFK